MTKQTVVDRIRVIKEIPIDLMDLTSKRNLSKEMARDTNSTKVMEERKEENLTKNLKIVIWIEN
jgi:hypothetical protein